MNARWISRGGRVRGAVRVLLLLWIGLFGGFGCAEEGAEAPSDVAELSLPLTVISNGVTYRLQGTFLVRASPAEDAPVVQTLRTADDPGATSLRAALPSGSYYVYLAPDWQLVRDADGKGQPLRAALVTDNPLLTSLEDGAGAQLTFRFAVDGTPLESDGELRVNIAIETDVCGDGKRGKTEACDDAARNGSPGRCDGSCGFRCEAACPLRVDPGVRSGGSGATWSLAMRDLQRAIDTQAALGGGEVWVRGGTLDVLDAVPKKRLTVPGKIRLRGGFAGTETRPGARDPLAPRTRIGKRPTPEQSGDLGDPDDNLLRIVAQQDVLIERVHLTGYGYPLRVEKSDGIVLRDFSMESYHGSQLRRSQVRFENARFSGASYGYLEAYDARVTITDGRFVNGLNPSGLLAEHSRVMLERVVSDGPMLLREGSKGLFVDSTFRGSADRGGYVEASDVVVVGSQFVNDGIDSVTAAAPLSGDSVFVWNSSFVRLENSFAGGNYPGASAIEAPKLEVAASTFYINRCYPGPRPCNVDIRTAGASPVHNSLFVHPEKTASNQSSDQSVEGTSASRNNCVSTRPADFDAEPNGSGRVLARSHPCRDRGDAKLLEEARKRLLARLAPFLGPPFEAKLTRYASAAWWRGETALADQCTDTNAPEPGRHFVLACAPKGVPAK